MSETGGARILVADDSAVSRALIVAGLSGQGHELIEAENGIEALELLETQRPDVLLLDIVMPQLSGLEVLERVQADEELRHIPVVCLTGQTATADVVAALERGAHDYLRKPFEPAELLARVGSAVRIKRLSDELRARNVELEIVSRTDRLTGLPNRLQLEHVLNGALSQVGRHGMGLSLLMIDVDRFKSVNDTHGHPVGDLVLCEIARRLGARVRSGDTVGRWGGEEFLAVLPHADEREALTLAQDLCAAVSASPVRVDETLELAVSVSIGVASGSDGHQMLVEADSALYQVKQNGRGYAALLRRSEGETSGAGESLRVSEDAGSAR